MRIAIGADHAGFEMKRDLAAYLAKSGHEVTDMGTIINKKQFDRVCGYIGDGLRQDSVRVVIGEIGRAHV